MADDAATEQAIAALLADAATEVARLAQEARTVLRDHVPGAVEEVDPQARLIGYTYAPGTYKGLVAAIALHRAHVNIMFSRGAELVAVDEAGLLEGTGKRARHVKVRDATQLADPALAHLLAAAAKATPR